jgi:lipoate synthase
MERLHENYRVIIGDHEDGEIITLTVGQYYRGCYKLFQVNEDGFNRYFEDTFRSGSNMGIDANEVKKLVESEGYELIRFERR